MSHAAAEVGSTTGVGATYGAAGLRTDLRELHTPRVRPVNVGWVCVAAAIGLSMLGIAAIGTTAPREATQHAVHLAIGLLAAATVALPHHRWLQRLSYPLLLVMLGVLVFVLIPVVPEAIVRPRKGARRWISLVVMDVQPSELAKIAYVLALASYLRLRTSYRSLRGLLLPLVLTFIPMGLILVEPDLGTAMLFLPTLFAMLVAAGAKLKHLILVVGLGLAVAPMMYPLLRPHQKDRIAALVYQLRDDDRYESDIGYQGARAMTLVGAGGVRGVGRAHAAELFAYNKLPEEHNDMIFAVICCRWGLIGAFTTWGLFATLAAGGLLVAAQARDPFARLMVVGVVALLVAQMTINTGMTIGLMPITGMTLPFVSSGGSSLIATWMMVGLIMSVAMRRPPRAMHRYFEFDESEDAA